MSVVKNRQPVASRRAWRVFWVLVLACHAPLTIHAFATLWSHDSAGTNLARFVLLSACNLFFLLEIAFAPCLRLVADRRTAVALLLIVAILHTGVIQSHLPDVLAVRGAQFWIPLTVVGFSLSLRRVLRLARAHVDALTNALGNSKWVFSRNLIDRRKSLALRPIEFTLRSAPLRAPPIFAS